MDEFKLIVRLLAAIKAGEDKPDFNCALVDEKSLKAIPAERDRMAQKLQKAGYIEGLYIIDDVDNQTASVILWQNSHPSVTLAGLQYIRENSAVRKAAQEIKDAGIAVASQAIANVITTGFCQ